MLHQVGALRMHKVKGKCCFDMTTFIDAGFPIGKLCLPTREFEGLFRRRNEDGTSSLAFFACKRPLTPAQEEDYYPVEVRGFTKWNHSRYTLIEQIDQGRCRYKGAYELLCGRQLPVVVDHSPC